MISVTLLTSQDWELSQTNPILRYKVGKLKIHPCGSNYLFESRYTADPLHHQMPKGPAMSCITRVACRRQVSTLINGSAVGQKGVAVNHGSGPPSQFVSCVVLCQPRSLSFRHEARQCACRKPIGTRKEGHFQCWHLKGILCVSVVVSFLVPTELLGAQLRTADSCKPQIAPWLAEIFSNAGLRLRQPGSFLSANQIRLPGDPTRSRIGKDAV